MVFLSLGVALVLWVGTARADDGLGIGLFGSIAEGTKTDETIPAPTVITAEPFAGDGVLGSGLLLRWPSVPGVSGYRFWRKIIVDYGLDASGERVRLDPPEERWLPWGRADVSSDGLEVRVVLMSLDGIPAQWGVSAFVLRDGVEYHSAITPVEDPATMVAPSSWAMVKHLGGRR